MAYPPSIPEHRSFQKKDWEVVEVEHGHSRVAGGHVRVKVMRPGVDQGNPPSVGMCEAVAGYAGLAEGVGQEGLRELHAALAPKLGAVSLAGA